MKRGDIDEVDHFLLYEQSAPTRLRHMLASLIEAPREMMEVGINRELNKFLTSPSMMQLLFELGDFGRYGRKVYAIGPNAQELLSRTSLAKVPKEAVKIPLPSFYVALPGCPWEIWGGARTRWHRIGGVYTSIFTRQESWDLQETTARELNRLGGRDKSKYQETPLNDGDDPDELAIIRMLIWGMPNEKSTSFGDDSISFFSLFLRHIPSRYPSMEEMCIDRAQKTVTGATGLRTTDPEVLSKDPAVVKKHSEAVLNSFRVVLNLLLYLSSDEAETRVLKPERRKLDTRNKKKLRREMRRSSSTVYIVGESLEKVRRESAVGTSGTSLRRHWVTGHWHTYWYGPRDGERVSKLRWVKPFLRGEGDTGGSTTRVEVRD
jgi:hypothetical protein